MRTSFVVTLICIVAVTAGVIGFLKGRSGTPAPPTVAGVAAEKAIALPAESVPFRRSQVQASTQAPGLLTEASPPTPGPTEPVAEEPAPSAPVSSPFGRAIDTLVSSQVTFQQKQAALDQLHASGQLDAAIESLERGAAEHPDSAAYPAALGQAQLRKAGELASNGGTVSEMGLLGMHADQNFDAALQLDPENWEAQFFKAAAMSYWPLELNKGDEVIQRLSNLIDQQNTMLSQPEFAQTYVILGDQYLKMDQPEYALATWQIGAGRFPGDPLLREKLNGQ